MLREPTILFTSLCRSGRTSSVLLGATCLLEEPEFGLGNGRKRSRPLLEYSCPEPEPVDRAAFRRKFDSVGQQIPEDLLKPGGITLDRTSEWI
jgi:hypothetical protein